MKLLIDTHAFLWLMQGNPRLSRAARNAMEHPANELLFSIAGAWEIAIKVSTGGLTLQAPFTDVIPGALDADNIRLLAVSPEHLHALVELPYHHKDPFDRMMVAQAVVEGATLVTADAALAAYGVPILW